MQRPAIIIMCVLLTKKPGLCKLNKNTKLKDTIAV